MSDERMTVRPREPAFNVPGVVLACCIVLLAIQAGRGALAPDTDDVIVANLAFVPARLAIALDLARVQLEIAVRNVPQETFTALIGTGGGKWWTLVTYALLHGSWPHVGFNCVWLLAFGAPVARRFSTLRFLLLLLAGSVCGALSQFAATPASFIPVVGASAAVAAAMGAATRFIFRPADAPSRSLEGTHRDEVFRQPALTLLQTLTTRSAIMFVVFWFVSNLLFGLFPSLSGIGDGPIAWQAHIGGFLAGLILFPLFDPRRAARKPDIDLEDTADLLPGEDERGP